jgi:nucleotide-binding universal stress UspA family protein
MDDMTDSNNPVPASHARLDTIVVPLDGSSVAARALPIAKHLAELHGASVILLTSTWNGQGATPEQLADAADELRGVETRSVVSDDSPATAASDLVLAGDHRVLCMSSHGRGGLRRAVLGSVADEIIREGRTPVVVVGPSSDPHAFSHPGPLELCVDGSHRSAAVVAAGHNWAQSLGRSVHLVLVSHPMDPMTGPESKGTFTELLRPLGLDPSDANSTCAYSTSVPMGLVIEAEQLKSPLMVIAPAVRSRVARAVLGSTTLAILSDAPCPVLVLPKGASDVEAP